MNTFYTNSRDEWKQHVPYDNTLRTFPNFSLWLNHKSTETVPLASPISDCTSDFYRWKESNSPLLHWSCFLAFSLHLFSTVAQSVTCERRPFFLPVSESFTSWRNPKIDPPEFFERNGKGEKCHKVPILKILTNDGFGLRALRAVKRLKGWKKSAVIRIIRVVRVPSNRLKGWW